MTSIDSLDAFDLKILDELQSNGRIRYNELAERVGLSKTPCLNRVKRLEKQGIITGYRASLDADKMLQGYLVFIQVKLADTRRESLAAFNDAVQAIPEIMSCHMMAGGFDYLLKVRTRDMRTYRHILGDVLAALPGVDQTSSFPVMEQVKETPAIPIRSD